MTGQNSLQFFLLTRPDYGSAQTDPPVSNRSPLFSASSLVTPVGAGYRKMEPMAWKLSDVVETGDQSVQISCERAGRAGLFKGLRL